jgi:hypothetical protein
MSGPLICDEFSNKIAARTPSTLLFIPAVPNEKKEKLLEGNRSDLSSISGHLRLGNGH